MESQEIADLYDAFYYATGCGPVPYERTDGWLDFFDSIAKRIQEQIAPRSVLDAGCGMGFLVEALHNREIEAFGFDISEYAIGQVHPDIQDFCWVGSINDPLPRSYDLIVCIEVLEHLPPVEAELAVENLCRYSNDILFSSTPFDYKEPTHFNVQPPEYWVALFARHGFFRDIDFDGSFITTWTIRFRKSREPISRIISTYERRLWQLGQENQARRELGIEQRNELSAKEYEKAALRAELKSLSEEVEYLKEIRRKIEQSPGWQLLQKMQSVRARIAPPRSVRDQSLTDAIQALQLRSSQPLKVMFNRINQDIAWRSRSVWWRLRVRLRLIGQNSLSGGKVIYVEEVDQNQPPIKLHQANVEIIVCVHNALDDVKRCLEAVIQNTNQPYRLILVDDGSNIATHHYLAEFAKVRKCVLLTNEQAKGYTLAANQGLHRATADHVVLLNSDTIVTAGWLDRLIDCIESSPDIGVVGPLSNTASWQSIPEIEFQGDWATNILPEGVSIEEMGRLVAYYSARLYPAIPFLNGFCLLIRRQILEEIGYFDEENFGAGYGEENDYALRTRKAGWKLALADNAYIYHAQSRSYSDDRRRHLSENANEILIKKHGQGVINDGVAICRHDRVLEGIRMRSRAMLARHEWLMKGKAQFEGRRVLFILPVFRPGGGANVVIDEAIAMRQMGVDVHIFNLSNFREKFERGYPDLKIPVHFGDPEHLSVLANEYDALIATFHASVKWLTAVVSPHNRAVLGYYIQDFEPYMYSDQTVDGYKAAWDSYTLIPELIKFAKTEWTQQEIRKQTGAEVSVVGISANIDLFRPRPRSMPDWPQRPLRVVAMVRVDSPHRQPQLTMQLLEEAFKAYGNEIEIIIFGTDLEDPGFSTLSYNFPWKLAGTINQKQVARLMNEVDIFVDFSSHQAMGLTALEAMACGVAVIVPQKGGAVSFARHEVNSLVIDTSSKTSCGQALKRLIEEHQFRAHLQRQALFDVGDFFPERPAFNILETLFNPKKV